MLNSKQQAFEMETWHWSTYTKKCNTAAYPTYHNLLAHLSKPFLWKDNQSYILPLNQDHAQTVLHKTFSRRMQPSRASEATAPNLQYLPLPFLQMAKICRYCNCWEVTHHKKYNFSPANILKGFHSSFHLYLSLKSNFQTSLLNN